MCFCLDTVEDDQAISEEPKRNSSNAGGTADRNPLWNRSETPVAYRRDSYRPRVGPRRAAGHLGPYVVLIGDVGAGKSTIVEKLTGKQGLQGDGWQSHTRTVDIFPVSTCSSTGRPELTIADTPGANPLDEKFEHNKHIADAITYADLSLLLIVVKADTRIANTIQSIETYAQSIVALCGIEYICPCITHMDQVKWTSDHLQRIIRNKVGLENAVFSKMGSTGAELKIQILEACQEPKQLTVTAHSFLRFFDIAEGTLAVMTTVKDELHRFKELEADFFEKLNDYSEDDRVDLVFEFKTFMFDEIVQIQRRVSDKHNFTYDARTEKGLTSLGYLANLKNQLKAVLHSVRIKALHYQRQHGINSGVRSCPYCGQVWMLTEGCHGTTTCGEKDTIVEAGGGKGIMARFTLRPIKTKDAKGKDMWSLAITKNGQTKLEQERFKGNAGCGKQIAWKDMAPVKLPDDFREDTNVVHTQDVEMFESERQRRTFEDRYDNTETQIRDHRTFTGTEI